MGPDKPTEEEKKKRKAYGRAYYARNRDQILARGRERYQKNREAVLRRNKEYADRTKEHRRVYSRLYRALNADRVLAAERKRRASDAGVATAKKRYYTNLKNPRRRFNYLMSQARSRGLVVSLTYVEYCEFAARSCGYCEQATGTGVGLDRIDNAQGYNLDNVVPCCGRCNRARGDDFTYEEMRDFLAPAIRAVLAARQSSKLDA